MASCYIGLGANIQDPEAQIIEALKSLSGHADIELEACSSLYGSKPQGPEDQPDYLNAVARISTKLEPIQLLDSLQKIEQEQGRVKLRRWGERCIDLDILLYDQQVIRSERLVIPHPQMHNRDFVVTPLLEIEPDLSLPNKQRLQDVQPEFSGEVHKLRPICIDF